MSVRPRAARRDRHHLDPRAGLPHRLPARSPAEPGREGPRSWRWWSRGAVPVPPGTSCRKSQDHRETKLRVLMFDRCRDRGPAPPGGCPAEEGHGQGPALRRAARAGREVPGRRGPDRGRAPADRGRHREAARPGQDRRLEGRDQGLGRSGPRRGQAPELGLLPVRHLRGPRSLRHPAGR